MTTKASFLDEPYTENIFLDEAGKKVQRFISAAHNLTRIGELRSEIVDIAKSGAWRNYRTASGRNKWLECEFDYFLIAAGLEYQDVSRVIATTGESKTLAAMMDRTADSGRRRSLQDASKAWYTPSPETLIERAERLGWKNPSSAKLKVAPVSQRAREQQAYGGMSKEKHARIARRERIPAERRKKLDELATGLRSKVTTGDERWYLIDCLREKLMEKDKPSTNGTSSRVKPV